MFELQSRLATLTDDQLRAMRRGLEKESLRVGADGSLAHTPHPAALGCALTHPRITTDYSEAQLELITGVHASAQSCIDELTRIHQFVVRELGSEMMWVSSMPCMLPADEAIPLGHYGHSHIGRMKTIYRMGLGWRYGRRMQTISGIHYNWSMPGIDNDAYFGLIRNFRRESFLLLLLFGASPAVCASFVAGRQHQLQSLSEGTLYMPHGTSLRMGRLGYQSDAQSGLAVSYNCLDSYARSLHEALTQPYPAYEAIGLKGPDGNYRQLATTLLQIENEFYGTIRPKRVIQSGERPLHALRQRGVEYVEVRCMDLDPFEPVGIAAGTLRFLDLFLLHCLLSDSPPDSPAEIASLARNQHAVAAQGRDPALRLERGGEQVSAAQWASDVVAALWPLAHRLDALEGSEAHASSLQQAVDRLAQMSHLPSAKVLVDLKQNYGNSYTAFARTRSRETMQWLQALPLAVTARAEFQLQAAASLAEQQALEAAPVADFEQFRQSYLAPERLLA